jgi:hypothetical protein
VVGLYKPRRELNDPRRVSQEQIRAHGRVRGTTRNGIMNRSFSKARPFGALVLILIHFVVSSAHGWAHQAAMVTLTTFGYVYVGVVITLTPLLAAALLFTRKKKIGALLLALAMFGSFIFGFWYHFLSQTSDNVTQAHGPWHSTFLWTATALAVIELAGTVVGFRMFRASNS